MSQEVNKLKELLFDSENRAISNLEHRLDIVFKRSGTEDRFRTSVAGVLDGALREAEVERHQALSDAISPLIVRTIKTEITNSQDELAEALYPMTGRMVKSYVASAIKDLTNQINRSFERNPFMLRINSLVSGRSVAELALADAQALNVEELYLIKRGSGELVARWPKDLASSNRDQVMSGILTAINEFALEAFNSDGSALRQIDLGDSQVYLRGSPTYLLAAKCTGTAASAIEQTIDDEFLKTIEKHHDLDHKSDTANAKQDTDDQRNTHTAVLAVLAESLTDRIKTYHQDHSASGSSSSPVKALLWVIGLATLTWVAWTTFHTVQTLRTQSKATYVLSNTKDMSGFPITIGTSNYGTAITVDGLTPSQKTKKSLLAGLRAMLPTTTIHDQLNVVDTKFPDHRPELSGISQRIDGLTTQVQTKLSGLANQVTDLDSGVTNRIETLSSRLNRDAITRATSRASSRLSASLPDLKSLILSLDNPQARKNVEDIQSQINALIPQIQTQYKSAADQNTNEAMLENLKPKLAKLTADIEQSTRQLTPTLLTERSAKTTTTNLSDEAPTTPAKDLRLSEAAENLALAAEHFATLSAATTQASQLNPTARQNLQAWAHANAVFFANDKDFTNRTRATQKLKKLAQLINKSGNLVRVVGFTDEKGAQESNSTLSLSRAAKVRQILISHGVSAELLVAVGRRNAKELSPQVGEQSPNRRVEFELGFVGERAR